MKQFYKLIVLFLILALNSCSESAEVKETKVDYTINIIKKLDLAIPSGSGITGYQGGFLTVGDDTPWLYYLDSAGTLTDSLRLSYVEGYVPGVRMASSFKPDFESITRLNEEIILIMGSGSYNSGRDTAYLVNGAEHRILAKKSLAPLFASFAELAGIDDVHKINIEGIAVANHDIYFFNRGDLSGKSIIFKSDLYEFITYFTSGDHIQVSATYFLTPYNEEYGESTYSACIYVPQSNVFIYSSTLEEGSRMDSTGVIIDGDIKGSFLGRIRMSELTDSITTAHPITENGALATVKIEGIWMYQALSDSIVQFIGVSDPDDGSTETFIIEVKINRLN